MADKTEKLLQSVDRLVEVEKQKQTSLLRDRFTEKEDPLMQVKSEIAKSNEILQKMLEKDKEGVVGGSGIGLNFGLGGIGAIGKSLIGGLTGFFGGAGAAALFSKIGSTLIGGLGVGIAAAFTVNRVVELSKVVNEYLKDVDYAENIKGEVIDSQQQNLEESNARRVESGDITQERSEELNKRNKELANLEDTFYSAMDSNNKILDVVGKITGTNLFARYKEFLDAGIITLQEYLMASIGNTKAADEKIQKELNIRRAQFTDYQKMGVIQPDSQNYLELVKQRIKMNESYGGTPELTAYKDTEKGYSVGFGHFRPGDELKGKTITPEEAEKLFEKDFAKAYEAAQQIPLFESFNKEGKAALIDLTYNMGPNWWKTKFPNTFKRFQETGDVTELTESLGQSKYAKQVGKRANQNIDSLLTNVGRLTQNDAANLPSKARDEDTFVNKIVDGFKSALEVMAKSLAPQIGKEVANNIPKPKQTSVNYNPSID